MRRPHPRTLAVGALCLAMGLSATGCSQVGTFLPGLVNGTTAYSTSDKITEAKALGVKLQRIHQVVGKPLSSDLQAFAAQGIQTQMTIKASAGTQISSPARRTST